IGSGGCETLAGASADISRRIVLITPNARHELPALKTAGFSGYLVKPVRAGSLAARLAAADQDFERAGEAAADAERKPAEPRRAAGLAELVAEDNGLNALVARALLAKLGHRPSSAGDGASAYDTWHEARAPGE